MSFGMEGAPKMHWSKENLKFAIGDLSERPPVFGEDTGEKDGKYFAMGREVQKEEYDLFIKRLDELLGMATDDLGKKLEDLNKLDKAA